MIIKSLLQATFVKYIAIPVPGVIACSSILTIPNAVALTVVAVAALAIAYLTVSLVIDSVTLFAQAMKNPL